MFSPAAADAVGGVASASEADVVSFTDAGDIYRRQIEILSRNGYQLLLICGSGTRSLADHSWNVTWQPGRMHAAGPLRLVVLE